VDIEIEICTVFECSGFAEKFHGHYRNDENVDDIDDRQPSNSFFLKKPLHFLLSGYYALILEMGSIWVFSNPFAI
jgi:hypothetical protein